MIHVADGRLQSPALGTNAIRAPLGSDWTWRPGLWRGLSFAGTRRGGEPEPDG
ncbi:MAG: DUF6478 family protein [Paracoccaceae bacterium]